MLRFTLCTTLLLAATCVLMTAVSAERAVTCDAGDNVHHLICDQGVISVYGGLYGRADTITCSEGRPWHELSNTACSKNGVVDVLKNRCNGKKECEINTGIFYTSDPCVGTYKYVETNYICVPATHVIACEHSVANLYCGPGQVISVYRADYGRRDQTTCAYRRPAPQIQNVACSHPTSKVADSCNGKNSCSVRAVNSVFGDPCFGIYKYLEVTYTCVDPGVSP